MQETSNIRYILHNTNYQSNNTNYQSNLDTSKHTQRTNTQFVFKVGTNILKWRSTRTILSHSKHRVLKVKCNWRFNSRENRFDETDIGWVRQSKHERHEWINQWVEDCEEVLCSIFNLYGSIYMAVKCNESQCHALCVWGLPKTLAMVV